MYSSVSAAFAINSHQVKCSRDKKLGFPPRTVLAFLDDRHSLLLLILLAPQIFLSHLPSGTTSMRLGVGHGG